MYNRWLVIFEDDSRVFVTANSRNEAYNGCINAEKKIKTVRLK